MRNILCLVMIAVFAMISGCAWKGYGTSSRQMNAPGPDAARLYTYITRDVPYTGWKPFPGKSRRYPGEESHRSLPTTYFNRTAFKAIKKQQRMADGSMVVKENYTTDGDLSTLTVMYKIRGYNPEAGDWFWAQYNPDGSLLISGKAEVCINCHSSRAGNDYLFSGEAPEPR